MRSGAWICPPELDILHDEYELLIPSSLVDLAHPHSLDQITSLSSRLLLRCAL